MNPTDTEERVPPATTGDPEPEPDETLEPEAEEEEEFAEEERPVSICDECGAEGGHKLGCSRLEAFRNALQPDPEDDNGAGRVQRTLTIVDGREAHIDQRGNSQRISEASMRQPPLIEENVTDESCLQRIAQCKEEEAEKHGIANKAVNAFKEAKKRTDAAVTFAAEHWAQSRQIAMEFTVARAGGEPED